VKVAGSRPGGDQVGGVAVKFGLPQPFRGIMTDEGGDVVECGHARTNLDPGIVVDPKVRCTLGHVDRWGSAPGPAERFASAELAEHRLCQRDVAGEGGVVAIVDQEIADDAVRAHGAKRSRRIDQDTAVPRRNAAERVLKRGLTTLWKPVQIKGQAKFPPGLCIVPRLLE
jgi:hypothetical protein